MANLPSRADMQRPQLKADLAENVLRTYDALWRRARVTHSALIDTTWRQLAKACGYPPETRVDGSHTSTRRYLELLAEAGLVTWGGQKTSTGRWQCLHVELLEPPPLASVTGRSSSAGQAPFACDARRRRETPAQRAARRRQPWRRSGGRRDAVARHDLSWRLESGQSLSETSPPDYVWRGEVVSVDACARGRGRNDATPCRAQAPRNGGDEEGELETRRQARKARRRDARDRLWARRNEQLVVRLWDGGEIDDDDCDRRIAAIRRQGGLE
jgi:hypothetical protein